MTTPATSDEAISFNSVFLGTLEKSLQLLVDDSAKDSFISHLEKNCGVSRDEISRSPELLSNELRNVFGLGTAKIEELFLLLLYTRLGLSYVEKERYEFSDYIREARQLGKVQLVQVAPSQKLSKRDIDIISALMSDGRKSITQLARETGLSRPTVTNRLEKLIKEKVISVEPGLNLKKLECSTACLTVETEGVDQRRRIEKTLSRCPRVLMMLRLAEKANLMVTLYGEDQDSLRSTIESIGSWSGASILNVSHAEPPLYPETFRVPVTNEKQAVAPCGKDCSECPNYLIKECLGCPVTIHYQGQL
jgi:Lrp/AsnC family leucine-responsive transcriptional regulator